MNDYSELRAEHRHNAADSDHRCWQDDEPWPCSTIRLLDEVERLRAGLVEICSQRGNWNNSMEQVDWILRIAGKALGWDAALNSSTEVTA